MLQRGGMETLEGPRGWGGVSFRGIDVPQYSPDAVDTPICNDPDAQSLPSRETASRKCAKADLIQPLPASRRASGRARILPRASPWLRIFFVDREKNLRPFHISFVSYRFLVLHSELMEGLGVARFGNRLRKRSFYFSNE